MTWQDIVMMICIFGFIPALLPSILSKNKPARLTCLLSGILLSVITICFFSLHLWLSTIAEALGAGAWFVLLFQRREN